jgi:hypothetical protein
MPPYPRRDQTPPEFQFQNLDIRSGRSSSDSIVFAIDFGTTFSGVGYALSENLQSDDVVTLINNIGIITTWSGNQQSGFIEKTPTALDYNTNPLTWGGNVTRGINRKVRHFKLGLQPPPDRFNVKILEGESALPFLNPNYRHRDFPNKRAEDYAEDYLKCIYRYINEEFCPNHFGPSFLRGLKILYVVTVPAIWEECAKDLTKKAAEKAGFPKAALHLMTEPEAAALHCASLCNRVDLEEGHRFLVCDAGGGTVVRIHFVSGGDWYRIKDLIAYQIISKQPFRVKECNAGSGGTCGALFLHKGFEALLRKKLGRHAKDILTAERLAECITWFELYVQRVFNPLDKSDDIMDYRVPMTDVKNIRKIGLKNEYLKVSW